MKPQPPASSHPVDAAGDPPVEVDPVVEVHAEAASRPLVRPARRARVRVELSHPFQWGFAVAFGALTAILLGNAMVSLSTVLVYIGVALFLALSLDPLVRWLEAKGMSRTLSITVVFVGFALVFAGLLAIVVPIAISQVITFAQAVPGYVTTLKEAAWFQNLLVTLGTEAPVDQLLDQLRAFLSNPANLLAIGGGALAVGTGIVTGVTGGMMILILTLYFLASLRGVKKTIYRLAPAYSRPRVAEMTEQITQSVGSYMGGMFLLALANAIFSFILITLIGSPFAALLGFLALFITMIPMVGPVTFWLIASGVLLMSNWVTGLIFVVVYFAYLQVEAYVMTPMIMSKQISIPGSLVIIGALVGGTLLGLLGALVAVPVTAALLMIVDQIVVPKQDGKVVPPEGSALV